MSKIKFIDKRTDTHSPSEDERVAVETDRQARRRAVREAAAKRDLELQPALLAEADVRASEARCDELADSHQATCQPWQTELAELEKAAIARIGKREEPNTEEDERRAELAKLIASATADLEKAIAEERELQAERRRTARTIRQGHPPSDTILAALCKPPLVDPKLAIRSFCLAQKLRWAKARISAAEQGVKVQTHNLLGIQRGEISGDRVAVEIRLGGWEAELQAALDEQAAALAESDENHRAKLNE